MAQTYTTTELLVQIREMARISDDEPDATDAILLRKATEILQSVYAPAVRKVREDYYVATARIALVAGRASYPIPRRAVTASVRRVRLLDAQDREMRMTQIPYESMATSATGLRPTLYSLADDRIVVTPVPTTAAYRLEVVFEYRPAQLVAPSEAHVATYTWTEATLEHSFLTAGAPGITTGGLFDIVSSNPPFSSPLIDAIVSSVTFGGLITNTTSYTGRAEDLGYSTAASGLYLCAAGETPIPQIPAELHPILAKHTAAAWLAPIDLTTSESLKFEADREFKDALAAMVPRKLGQQMKMRPTAGGIRTRGARRAGGGLFNDWEP